MKKIDISKIYITPEKIIACANKINEILEELAKKGIIELEEDDDNE